MADTKGYVVGDWNAYCDYCGGQYLASQLQTDYWGFKACKTDFTLPNPQMFVRPKTEKIVVPWSRPTDGTNAFDVPTTAPISILTANVSAGQTIYSFTISFTAVWNVLLQEPALFTLDVPYLVSVTLIDTGVVGSLNFLPIGLSKFIGNTTVVPGQTAFIVPNKSTNKWTRIN